MDEFNSLVNIIKESMPLVQSGIPAIVGGFITALFMRGNTNRAEFEKIKVGKVKEAIDDLIENRELTLTELVKCKNLLDIAKIADKEYAEQVPDYSTNPHSQEDPYDFDWFMRYFETAGLISNEDMQRYWGKVLAGELIEPGKFSRSFIHMLSIVGHNEAQFFANVARFAMYNCKKESYHPFIFIENNIVPYANSDITRDKLLDLQHLGLVKCDFTREYIFKDEVEFRIGMKRITVFGDEKNDNKIQVGNVIFTKDGLSLYSILDYDTKKYRSDITDFTVARLLHRNCKVVINDVEVKRNEVSLT